jgi:nitroreductase
MQAIEALLTRRSATALTEPGPDEAALQLIFQSAVHAPDHGRLRPWRFVIVRGAARERFGELLAAHLQRTHAGVGEETLARERSKAFRAPLIIVVAAHARADVKKVPPIEQQLSAGAAVHAMMLAARALGFNAMWKTGTPAYDDTVKAALDLAPEDAIVGFLYVGTDTQPSAPAALRPWHDLVRNWGEVPARAAGPAPRDETTR